MRGERAIPALDAHALVEQFPALGAVPALEAETLLSVPGAHLTLDGALAVATRAAAVARTGEGVVITTGTDTLEELAVLCALLEDASAPIVLTGANRPDSRPGADGGANLIDAVTVAGSSETEALGALVVFGGEVHAAMTVRKVDSTGPAAFGSPLTGPLGRVLEGRVWIHARPIRQRALPIVDLHNTVYILTAAIGDDGAMLRAVRDGADGLVTVAFGAGHLSPGMLHELRHTAAQLPVVITCRPERSSMLFETYGFEGSESDLRASGALCAPFLSPVAARMMLLGCLGAGLDHDRIAATFAPWDAGGGALAVV
jgi:L-asparaginase